MVIEPEMSATTATTVTGWVAILGVRPSDGVRCIVGEPGMSKAPQVVDPSSFGGTRRLIVPRLDG